MGEEMENGSNRVYRGEWTSEMSQWMGWSSDSTASVKQISSDGPSGSDDSTSFIETKPNYAPALQFPEFGGPSPVWGPDFLIRSGLSYNQRYDRIIGVNSIKQEHLSFDLDQHSASFPTFDRRIPDMPALFPTTAVGEEEMCNSMPHKVPLTSHSHQLSFYSNSTPLWRGSVEMNGGNQIASGSCEKRPSGGNVAHKDSSSMETRKSNGETATKRLRSDSPAPFTTFKVRKEKLGDRITALQQLVSPFGKTDTASVLFDAIEYIKVLHDQVTVLSTPYMRLSHERCEGRTDREGGEQSLRSRGLCLVPISTTLHVAKDNPTDFWAPTFGGSYR